MREIEDRSKEERVRGRGRERGREGRKRVILERERMGKGDYLDSDMHQRF